MVYSASQTVYIGMGYKLPELTCKQPICALCGGVAYGEIDFDVSDTFPDKDKLKNSKQICIACDWFMTHRNTDLQRIVQKPTPQSARSYTFITSNSHTAILTKAHKKQMMELLSGEFMPEVVMIADSGQKYTFHRAISNPIRQKVGWMLFETELMFVNWNVWHTVLNACRALYNARYSKNSMLSGEYKFYPDSDINAYLQNEAVIAPHRDTAMLRLAVFIVQEDEELKERDETCKTTQHTTNSQMTLLGF